MITTERLSERLALIFRWYRGMVDSRTGLLEYEYLPETDSFAPERSPIRDIASIWDAAIVGGFVKRDDLRGTIERSLSTYGACVVEHEGALILDPRKLGEPSSIAHSAFMMLALLHAPPPRDTTVIAALADGIVRQQRPDGSYKVYFADIPDSGEELYAGEAMLALLEAFRELGDPRLPESAARGVRYYDAEYFQSGRVTDDLLVFFANWQSQAGRLLFEHAPTPALGAHVADFLFRMHDRVIASGFFDDVARNPARQISVEVACALEGLGDAYAVAVASHAPQVEPYGRAICAGLAYLLELQCTQDCAPRETGGFGMSLGDRTQRIDVTGHAASAFIKSIENGIRCPPG